MSSTNKPGRAKVRHTPLPRWSAPPGLVLLDGVCRAGERCQAVQASQPGRQSLAWLRQALATANASLANKASLEAALEAANKALKVDYTVAGTAFRAYEGVVGGVSGGDPAVINEAGLVSSDDLPATLAIPRKVTGLRSKPWRRAREAMLSWNGARGAEGYAIQQWVGALDDPEGRWLDLGVGNRRAYRVVTVPEAGARFHARVAAVGHDGATAAWSDPILVTAC